MSQWDLVLDRARELLLQGLLALRQCQELCWRLLELHSMKIVSGGIIWISLKEVWPPLPTLRTPVPKSALLNQIKQKLLLTCKNSALYWLISDVLSARNLINSIVL